MRKKSILVESIDHNGQLEIVEISGKALKHVTTSDLAKSRFKLLKSKWVRKVTAVGRPKTKAEEQLQIAGYANKYTAGVDSINYHFAVGNKTKEARVNPFNTHIEDFARQTPAHIRHTQRIIISQGKQVPQKLAILDNLKVEATLKIKNESVTYNWWLSFNERLDFLVNSSSIRESNSLSEHDYKPSISAMYVLQYFPDIIALPTIHRQGVFAANRFTFSGIVPVTLFDTLLPTQSFSNGLISITIGYGSKPKQPEIVAFHDYFIQEVVEQNPRERMALETAYYLLTRENTQYDNMKLSDFTNKEKIKTRMLRNREFSLRLMNPEDIGSLLSLVSLYQGNRSAELKSKYNDVQTETSYMAKLFSDFASEIIKKYELAAN